MLTLGTIVRGGSSQAVASLGVSGDTLIYYQCDLAYNTDGSIHNVLVHDNTRSGNDLYRFGYTRNKLSQIFYGGFNNGTFFGDTVDKPTHTITFTGNNITRIQRHFGDSGRQVQTVDQVANNLYTTPVWILVCLLKRQLNPNDIPFYTNPNIVASSVDSAGVFTFPYTCAYSFDDRGRITQRTRTITNHTDLFENQIFSYY